jgi:hypothetical protein
MIHIYYHIYAITGVDSIIDEQISLIEKNFKFPHILNVGISIANENQSTSSIIERFYKYNKPNYLIREVRSWGNEFTTIDLIEKDKAKFGDSDYILYIHTKGASKMSNPNYSNIESWRNLMNYFNIENCNNVFKIFEKTEYNTYGVLLCDINRCSFYSGNFWWMTGEYAKSIVVEDLYKNRFNAEIGYIQNGKSWKPYSAYNINATNHYGINFKREEYAI